MSNANNPNFVSELVMMAKAFEELPQVKAELEDAKRAHAIDGETIQRLELRLIDLKTELDAAHASTRKVEVERDHAERMFLETDDRLNAFRRLLGSFQTEAGALIAAAEPQVEPEPVIELPAEVTHESELHPQAEGVSVTVDPTSVASTDTNTNPTGTEAGTTSAGVVATGLDEAVSVPSDPTQATESSFESVSSGSASPVQPDMRQVGEEIAHSYPTEAPHPVDPTASSTAGDGALHATVEATADVGNSADASSPEPMLTSPSASVDDVGYHNEPVIKAGDGGWLEWDAWCNRMNLRYPRELGGWPPRNAPATA